MTGTALKVARGLALEDKTGRITLMEASGDVAVRAKVLLAGLAGVYYLLGRPTA